MNPTRLLLRRLKCLLLIKYHRLRLVDHTAYISYGSHVSRDLVAAAYSYVGRGSMIGPGVTLGAYSMIGPRVMCVGDYHRFDIPAVPVIFSGRPPLRPTVIGRDVWIGAGSIILAGVEIGDGAIVAAGTVVTKGIPPCEIHAGTPNRKLRDRFPDSATKDRHLKAILEPPVQGIFAERR